MKQVVIAGATGYLGRHLCAEFKARGWHVRALVRDLGKARQLGLEADRLVQGEATKVDSLDDLMTGADLVLSALGITRQKDGLTYWNVDYQANVNLLRAAERANVKHFGYIHVLAAEKMKKVALVQAKQAFVEELQASSLRHSVIAPSGYFSDMADFLDMARSGRVWLFGDGNFRLNPIDGRDLAKATAQAIEDGKARLEIGGPDIVSHRQLADMAFSALGTKPKITYLPDSFRKLAVFLLPFLAPRSVHGPAEFFLTAMGLDMIGEPFGDYHLDDHFRTRTKARRD